MKRKTLKDLEKQDWSTHKEDLGLVRAVFFNVKKEAIGWLKHIIKEEIERCDEPYNEESIKWIINTNSINIRFWMNRFNITKEDLTKRIKGKLR